MSSYTMQLKEFIERWSQDLTNVTTTDKIETGRTKLFDFDYPIFDPDYKKDFETHFIRNFYTREIGFETEGLFKFYLETWLIINMPYFNNLFKSELLTFDPLKNSSIDVSHHKANGGNQTTTANNTTTGSRTDDNFERQLHSDNPDSRLALTANDGQGVIEYANDITEQNENNSVSTNSTSNDSLTANANSTEDFTQHREGKIGVQSYSKMLNEYRDTFLRIETMIFKEMNQLFMGVY